MIMKPAEKEIEFVGIAPHTLIIRCPKHPTLHTATLYCWPHKQAGIWECLAGDSDTHEHGDLKIETIETWSSGLDDTEERQIYVCNTCGVQVEGDPELDAAEARTDMEEQS